MEDAMLEAKLRAIDADKDSMRSLATLQDAFLEVDLANLESNLGARAEDAKEKTRLLADTRLLVSDRRALTEQKKAAVEALEAELLAQMNAARAKREATLRQLRAERKAIEIAHAERQRFLNEKMSQLEIEQKQLWVANCELSDQKDCIVMLQKEIELARHAAEGRNTETERAEATKREAASRLESLRLSNKLRLSKMRVQIDSELRVQMEQQAYVQSLQSRLKVEMEAIVEEPEYVLNDTMNESAPPQGKQGLAVAYQNKEVVTAWLNEMKNAKKDGEDMLEHLRVEMEAADKKTAFQVQRSEERRITLRHEISKLDQYHKSLTMKLESLSLATPTSTALLPTDTPLLPEPDLLKAEEWSTPYAATRKYLQTSDKFHGSPSPSAVEPSAFDRTFGSPATSPTGTAAASAALGVSLHDEENNPMYNPDLPTSASSSMRSSIRARIEGYLPSTPFS